MEQIASYVALADYTVKIAESGFMEKVTSDTVHRMHVLFSAECKVDNYFDALPGIEKKGGAATVLGFLAGNNYAVLPTEIAYSLDGLRHVLDQLPSQRKVAFLENVQSIFECGQVIANTKDTREFVATREKEARSSANITLLIADEFYNNKAFSSFYTSAAVIRNYMDTIEDWREDQKLGAVSIPPVKLCFAAAKEALKRVGPVVAQHPNKTKLALLTLDWATRHIGRRERTDRPEECSYSKPLQDAPVIK